MYLQTKLQIIGACALELSVTIPHMLPLISLPRSELNLSAVGLGATAFGAGFPVSMGAALYTTFREAGGNCFDMAHCYGNGAAERNLGNAIRQYRDVGKVRVLSKGGHPAFEGYPRPDDYLSPEVVGSDVRESLERLQLDQIDLYFLHRDDPRVSVGEIIDMLNRLITAGRLGAIGASNWSTARMGEANAYAEKHGLHGFVASQPQFNLGHMIAPPETMDPCMRYLTTDDIDWHDRSGLPVMCYSPTASGYFASGGDRAKWNYDNAISQGRLVRVTQLARQLHATLNQIALAYLFCQNFPVIPILGTSSVEHLAESMAATKIRLTPEQVRWLRNGD